MSQSTDRKIQKITYVLEKEGKRISKTEKRKLENELVLLQDKKNPTNSAFGEIIRGSIRGDAGKGFVNNKLKIKKQNEHYKQLQLQIDIENKKREQEKIEIRKNIEETQMKKQIELETIKNKLLTLSLVEEEW